MEKKLWPKKEEYVDFGPLVGRVQMLGLLGLQQSEFGAGAEVAAIRDLLAQAVSEAEQKMRSLKADGAFAACEPDGYEQIRSLCPGGNSPAGRIPDLEDRMSGAVLGRFIGCTLGVPVESWSIPNMRALAEAAGREFPPRDYWSIVERPWGVQYGRDRRENYTRDGMHGVPVDDDITYTILGLLILEKYGFDFTTADVGAYWKEALPVACTAEAVALENLKKGVSAEEAIGTDNPYLQWIGADIRADGFAYAAAGDPALAASLGYRDACLTHRRNGIYGEMFFAAAEAAAFTVRDPLEAIRLGLREIPATCALAEDIRWALAVCPDLKNYEEARNLVDSRFGAMHGVHTNNNACLTVFGLALGKGDFTETVGMTVAMGRDNDCTAATAGSILGAIVGEKGIPKHWTARFEDQVRTYINGVPSLSIRDVTARFLKLAESRLDPEKKGHL